MLLYLQTVDHPPTRHSTFAMLSKVSSHPPANMCRYPVHPFFTQSTAVSCTIAPPATCVEPGREVWQRALRRLHGALQVRFLARSFGVPGDHPGQQSNGYRWVPPPLLTALLAVHLSHDQVVHDVPVAGDRLSCQLVSDVMAGQLSITSAVIHTHPYRVHAFSSLWLIHCTRGLGQATFHLMKTCFVHVCTKFYGSRKPPGWFSLPEARFTGL